MWVNAYQSELQALDTCVNSLLPQFINRRNKTRAEWCMDVSTFDELISEDR